MMTRVDPMSKQWIVLYTKPRFEKKAHLGLCDLSIETYLPLQRVVKLWSDRKKRVEEPLFPGYVFVKVNERERLCALEAPGIVSCVSFNKRVAIVREVEIEGIRRLLGEGCPVEVLPRVLAGTRVKVIGGPLAGIEGVVTEVRGSSRFAVVVEVLRRSVVAEVPYECVDRIS